MRLLIQEPDQEPREIEIVDGLTIGRGAANSCVLVDDSASTAHARIVRVDGRLAIEDVGSSNGTRISGGSKLSRGEHFLLSSSLEIRIGRSVLRVIPSPDAVVEPGTARPEKSPVAEDAGSTRPRAAAPLELPTMRPPVAARPAESELGTQRQAPPKPSIAADEPTLRPVARGAPSEVARQPAPPAPPARPAPQAVLPPVSKPASAASIPIPATIPKAGDPLADLGIGGTMVVGGQATDAAAVQAMLSALAPRLVFVAHKQGRVESVTERETKIGRRKGGPVAIGLDDEGVSANHALLSFDGRSFFLEDLESKNGTWVGETKLAPRSGRLEVRCDQKVRLGTVDVLFVRAPMQGEKPSPADCYPRALEALQEDPSVPQDKLREAQQQLARRHPGELLIAANAITVTQWCDAVEGARMRGKVLGKQAGGGSKKLLWMLGGALVVAAAVIVWQFVR